MEKTRLRNVLLAVAETLEAVPMRCDQVESAAKVHACARKLLETAGELLSEESEENEAENERKA